MSEDVTIGELGRRLDTGFQNLERRMDAVTENYLRRDLYDSFRKNDLHSLALLEDQVRQTAKQRATDRRLLWSTLAAPVLVGLILLLLTAVGRLG